MTKTNKHFSDQLEDEEVLYVFHKHPIVMRKGLVFGMFGPLIGVLPATFKPELGFGWFFGGMLLGVLLGILIYIPSWISWNYTTCVVTNQRFIQYIQKGLFHRTVNDLTLNHIQSMNYSVAGFWETVLNFGTITMQTYMGDIKITFVHRPAQTSNAIQEILRDEGIVPEKYGATEQDEKES